MAYQRKTRDVNISPKLQEILERIANKSEIAKKLLRSKISKEDLVDDPIDYLSVSKEDPSKISYAYAEKLEKVDPEEYWTFKGRVQAKPAAAIKKFLKNVTEQELNIFTSLYKAATAQKDFIFDVVSGEEIKKYYYYKSYKNASGTLYNSCMKHDHCVDYFNIYIKNPEVCSMLIMLDNDGLLIGRALLWNAIDVEAGVERKVMDRIYCINDDRNMHYFKEWADENGYIYKKEQRWQNSLYFESFGKSYRYNLSVKIKPEVFTKYPYVDTFKFWDEKNSIICNFLPQNNGYIRTMIGNDGRTFAHDCLELDTITDMYEHRDRVINLDYPINGVYHRTLGDNLRYSECMNRYIHPNNAEYIDEINDWIFNKEYEQYNDNAAIDERRKYFGVRTKKMKLADIEPGPGQTINFDDFVRETTNELATDFEMFDENDMQPIQEGQVEGFVDTDNGYRFEININDLGTTYNLGEATLRHIRQAFGIVGREIRMQNPPETETNTENNI